MTQILRAEGAVWANAPKMYRDGLLNPGSLYLIDCADSQSNTFALGAIPNNAPFASLVPGGAYWVTSNLDGDTGLRNDGNAGIFVDNADSNEGLYASLVYDMAGKDFLACVWYKQSAGYSVDNYQAILCNAFDFSSGSFSLSTNGLNAVAQIRGVGGYAYTSATVVGAINQIAVARQNGKFLVFRDGQLVHSADALGPTLTSGILKDGVSAIPAQGVNNALAKFKGSVYRLWKEDLTVSQMSAAAQVRKDWEMNRGRFV